MAQYRTKTRFNDFLGRNWALALLGTLTWLTLWDIFRFIGSIVQHTPQKLFSQGQNSGRVWLVGAELACGLLMFFLLLIGLLHSTGPENHDCSNSPANLPRSIFTEQKIVLRARFTLGDRTGVPNLQRTPQNAFSLDKNWFKKKKSETEPALLAKERVGLIGLVIISGKNSLLHCGGHPIVKRNFCLANIEPRNQIGETDWLAGING